MSVTDAATLAANREQLIAPRSACAGSVRGLIGEPEVAQDPGLDETDI
jgi:hypothetical protein